MTIEASQAAKKFFESKIKDAEIDLSFEDANQKIIRSKIDGKWYISIPPTFRNALSDEQLVEFNELLNVHGFEPIQ